MSRAATAQPPHPEATILSRRETSLLLKINQGPPPEWHPAHVKLVEKRREGRLSAAEEKQLLKL